MNRILNQIPTKTIGGEDPKQEIIVEWQHGNSVRSAVLVKQFRKSMIVINPKTGKKYSVKTVGKTVKGLTHYGVKE